MIFEQSKELRFVRIINVFTIFKNICQSELFLWYYKHVSFRGVLNWFLVNSIISQTVRRFLFLITKKAEFMRLLAFCKRLKNLKTEKGEMLRAEPDRGNHQDIAGGNEKARE